MKRPLLVAVVGYIIGIIWGLYFKFSIVLLCAILILLLTMLKFIKRYNYKKQYSINLNNPNSHKEKFGIYINVKRKFKMYSISRYFRYVKLILNRKVIITITIFSIISNTIVLIKNQKYDNLFKGVEEIELTGIVQELKSESQYKKVYKIRVTEVRNIKGTNDIYLFLNLDKKYSIQYGNKVRVKGEFCEPDVARNYGGFSYKEYLKTLNIYGTINASSIEIIGNLNFAKSMELENKVKDNLITQISNKYEYFNKYINELRDKIKQNANKYLENDTYPIYLGLILGDTSQIDKDVKEQFRDSSMSHILAVSGMHISYIILGITTFLNKTLGKKKAKIITIFSLVIYALITGFSPSIVRACIMGIMILLGSLLHRKNDTWTAISLSLLLILIYNPYLITSISLQYTYAGTIGIILFNKNVLNVLNKGKENKSKIKEICAISLSAQIFILPLTIFHFNTFGVYFLVTNILLSLIIGPIVIISFIFLITLVLDFGIAKLISIILNLLIKLILLISNLSFLPMAKIYIRTPKVFEIIIYCLIIIIFNFIYSAKHKKNPNPSNLRVKYLLEVLKYKFRENTKKFILFVLIVILISSLFFIISNQKKLNIHFVDVGQGDCCFIETPGNKTILIDGGGSEIGSFDVGKSTLIPYILDRGYTKIDYIIISHFDTDHVRADY